MRSGNVKELDGIMRSGIFPSGCLLASFNPKFEILSVNGELLSMLGFADVEELVAATKGTLLSLIHPDDMQHILREGGTFFGRDDIYEFNYRILCKNGQYRWVKQSSRHFLDGDDGRELLLASFMDITKTVQASNIFHEFVDNLPGGVFAYLDDEGERFEYVNPNFYQILGYTPEEFKEKFHDSFKELVYEEDRERVLKEIQDQMLISSYDTCEYRIEKKDGSLIWVSDVGHRGVDSNGKPCFYVVVIDITKSQLLSDALRKAEQANNAKSDFLSRMSHDIRTPMNAILGLTALAMDEPGMTPEIRNYLGKIDNSSQYLLGLINDILDVSKIESGKLELHPKRYEFNEFRQMVRMMIEPLAQQKNIEFVFHPGSTMFPVFVDKLRFNQIFINLLSNAVKFTPEGGKVEFSVQNNLVTENTVTCEFVICDNGIGMSPEFMTKMYEPFSQADNAVMGNLVGSGLGLTIVRSLVDLMHGNMRFESAIGKGTTVNLVLPLPLAPAIDKASEPETKDRETSLQGKTILVAEDHPLNMEIVVRMLEKKGFTVMCARNGQEAVDTFLSSPVGSINAVLMDIRMPVMNGYEATVEIRKQDRPDARTIPVIALTANAYDEDVKNSLKAGMNEHLSKPIQPEQLFDTLRKYVR
jgi:PAS domain S-box-containing protein